MERYSEPAEVRARSWLIGQRLPHGDPETVALVAARLEARRKGRWFDFGLFLAFAVPYVVWLVRVGVGHGGAQLFAMTIPIVIAMSISLVRRAVVWSRRERDTAARLHGRVTALERLTWQELPGLPTLVLLAALIAAALVRAAAVTVPPPGPGRSWRFGMVVLGSVYCAGLLALARRRSTVARDGVSLAADRYLRVEEATQVVGPGALFVAGGAR